MLIVEVVKGMLGPLAPVLDFILDNPALTSAVFLLWFVIYAAGRMQLGKIEAKTRDLVLKISRTEIARNPQTTPRSLYKIIYPRWSETLPQWGRFIPHRLDLWPVPVTAKNVAQKLPFSPEWIADVLREQNIPLADKNSNLK